MTAREKRKIRLRISNPLTAESNPVISLYHFERYKRQGRAILNADGEVVFTQHTPIRVISAEQRIQLASRSGYDRAADQGIAPRRASRNLPMERVDIAYGCGQNTGAHSRNFV